MKRSSKLLPSVLSVRECDCLVEASLQWQGTPAHKQYAVAFAVSRRDYLSHGRMDL